MRKLENILIDPKQSIKHVLRHMDAVGEKTMFVVNKERRLLGVATDGDIRRWILKGGRLSEDISRVMNCNPISLNREFGHEQAKELMIKREVECLPIVNNKKSVISAVWWIDLFKSKPKRPKSLNLPVIIMAGGEGVRLHPFTKILPKPLMPVGDKPIIEMIIDKFFDYGCKRFYLSLNYKSNLIKAYFSDFEHEYKISYILENKPLGTAGSLYLLKNMIKKTFFVSNCDILIEADYADILDFHCRKKNKITLVSSMKNFTIPYGVCKIFNGGILKSIREKPEYDLLVNTGMYVLEPSVLADIPKNRFYNITELINDYLEKGEKVGVYPVSEKSWLDTGQFEVLQEALKKFEA